jgi:hypothetical protein
VNQRLLWCDKPLGWDNRGFLMSRQTIALVALALAIMAAILSVSPKADVTLNQASTEVLAIDILGLTKAAKDMPAQQYAAH